MESLLSTYLQTSAHQTQPNRMADLNFNLHRRQDSFHRSQRRIRFRGKAQSIRHQQQHRIHPSVSRSVPPDLPAWWFPSMAQRRTHTVRDPALLTSVRLKMVKDGCPLVGSVGRITWGEPTMWIITRGLRPGKDLRITTTNRRSARNVRLTCNWSVGPTKVVCCRKTEQARVLRTCRMHRLQPRQVAAPVLFL